MLFVLISLSFLMVTSLQICMDLRSSLVCRFCSNMARLLVSAGCLVAFLAAEPRTYILIDDVPLAELAVYWMVAC